MSSKPKRTRRKRKNVEQVIRIADSDTEFDLDVFETATKHQENGASIKSPKPSSSFAPSASEVPGITGTELAEGGHDFEKHDLSQTHVERRNRDDDKDKTVAEKSESVLAKKKRRVFTVKYKLDLVAEAKKSSNRQVAR